MLNVSLQDDYPIIYDLQPKQPKARALRSTDYFSTRIRSSQITELNPDYAQNFQEEQAFQFAQQVENWLRHLRHELQIACTASLEHVSDLAEQQLLFGKNTTPVELIAVNSQHRIINLYGHLQKELLEHFGDQAQERYEIPNLAVGIPTTKTLQSIGTEYRNTLCMTENMSRIINKVYNKALDQCPIPFVIGKLAGKVDLGTLSLNMVACGPLEQKQRCLQELKKRIQGIIKAYFIRLEQEITKQFAATAYQLYDEWAESKKHWQPGQILA